jgi:DNA-binding NarL/FixJ family response regulator
MSLSPTSACRQPTPTRASASPGPCGRGLPIWASWCSVSTASPQYALLLLETGSEGRAYLLKERIHNRAQVAAAIAQVAEGGSVIDPTVVEQLVAANQGPRKTPLTTLTPRELEVLGEMAQGKSNAAIAATLVLSERAIEKHTNSIFSKLALTEERDLNRRVKAVLLYLHEHGTTA